MARKRMPDVLTDDQVLNPEFFRPDLEEMYESVDNMKTLAKKVSADIDQKYFDIENREMYGRGTLTFVSKQMETLASVHSGVNTGLNQIMAAKIKISQLSLSKQKNVEAAVDTGNLAREFQKLFNQNRNKVFDTDEQFEKQAASGLQRSAEDEALENRLRNLEASGEIAFTDNERAIQFEHRNVQICVQNQPTPHFVAIAGDTGELLPQYPQSLLPNNGLLQGATRNKNGSWHCNNTDYRSI